MVEWDNENIPATVQLANGITMPANTTFNPIGNSSVYYESTFDGCNHTIINLQVRVTSEYRGACSVT